jgi:hypothetical protein
MNCLRSVGLTDVRAGVEQGVWEGNVSGTTPTQTNQIVFVAGPYSNDAVAAQYANELTTIPETAKAGGSWVVSAAVTGHLGVQVSLVANCMAGPA